MTGSSFTFYGKNSFDDYGIRIIAYDVLKPKKRQRLLDIYNRDGSYDLGSKNFEDRELSIECIWENSNNLEYPKEHFREVAYWLSKKSRLSFWNEPDKYYIGNFYDTQQVTDYPKEVIKKFSLKFVGEPFAYSEYIEVPMQFGLNESSYKGTASTPTLITIENNGTTSISNIKIQISRTGD